eukprot:462007_1
MSTEYFTMASFISQCMLISRQTTATLDTSVNGCIPVNECRTQTDLVWDDIMTGQTHYEYTGIEYSCDQNGVIWMHKYADIDCYGPSYSQQLADMNDELVKAVQCTGCTDYFKFRFVSCEPIECGNALAPLGCANDIDDSTSRFLECDKNHYAGYSYNTLNCNSDLTTTVWYEFGPQAHAWWDFVEYPEYNSRWYAPNELIYCGSIESTTLNPTTTISSTATPLDSTTTASISTSQPTNVVTEPSTSIIKITIALAPQTSTIATSSSQTASKISSTIRTTTILNPFESTTNVLKPSESTTTVVEPSESTTTVLKPSESTTTVVEPSESTTTVVEPLIPQTTTNRMTQSNATATSQTTRSTSYTSGHTSSIPTIIDATSKSTDLIKQTTILSTHKLSKVSFAIVPKYLVGIIVVGFVHFLL